MADQVETILKRHILAEGLVAGDRLPPEREIASLLGVSHTSVREALARMCNEGLLAKKHGVGSIVQEYDPIALQSEIASASLSHPDPQVLHEARCALESGAAYLAAKHATEEEITVMQECIENMRQRFQEGERAVEYLIRFHVTLLKATHNDALADMDALIIESIRAVNVWNQPQLLNKTHLREQLDHPEQMLQGHQRIVDSIRARDEAGASAAVYQHLSAIVPVKPNP